MKEVTIKMSEKELAEVNKVLGALGKKIVPEENKKSQKVDIEPCEHEYEELKEEGPITYDIKSNGAGYIFIHHTDFEDANIGEKVYEVNMFANKTDIYLTDLKKDEIEWNGVEVDYWGNVARNFAGDFDIDITDVWEGVNPFGDTATVTISDHFINIHYDGVEESEETKEAILDYAHEKAEENKQLERAKQLIYEIFMDVEKIKKVSGIDLTDIITNYIKNMFTNK